MSNHAISMEAARSERDTSKSPSNQAGYQQALDDFAIPLLLHRLQTHSNTNFDTTWVTLKPQEAESLAALPNEIILSLEPSTSSLKPLLDRFNLEIVRPLQSTQNRYIVRSKTATGTAVLDVANQLSQNSGVKSATPNFIQAVSYSDPGQKLNGAMLKNATPASLIKALKLPSGATRGQHPFQTALLPLQWYLDSRSMQGLALPRTDVRAIESWQRSPSSGKGVVIGVIDSLIQWDHPDLAANLSTASNVALKDRLPGEVSGWDFAQNDPDTRISPEELKSVRSQFQDTFQLSDAEYDRSYAELVARVLQNNPGLPKDDAIAIARNYIRNQLASEFHGTWSTGVIVARPKTAQGVDGVAPNAKFLPIRVFGLGGAVTTESISNAIRYAAIRKVDVINMSLGGSMPTPKIETAIAEVLAENSNLVIVASAGNDDRNSASYPAAFPGVVSVGATNLAGQRAPYSNYGERIDVVALGGDTSEAKTGGILTTGGTFAAGFWQGIQPQTYGWGVAFDPQGQYVLVQGTSFSAPATSGVVALMRGEDPKRRLSRDLIVSILKQTASYDSLKLPSEVGIAQADTMARQQFLFGSGLVNAEAAIAAMKQTP